MSRDLPAHWCYYLNFANHCDPLACLCPLQLYLSSDHKTLLRSAKKSWLQEVHLTDEVSHLARWQATFLDPQLRLEHEGFPVRVSALCTGQDTGSTLQE